jgi:ribosomal protein S12 methylthiotransferase accessory factor
LLGRRSVEGLDVHFHDLTVDGEVPVVGVTCIEDSGRPCFFILSAAAGVDMLSAARKAMTEAGQGRPFIKTIALTQESSQADGVFNDFDRNLRFYAEPANRHFIAWFLGNSAWSERRAPAVDEAREPTDQLTRLLGKCSHMGLRPIVFDMTLPEMRDRGLFACRVIVPELVPLCVPSAPFLGHPRLAGFMDAAKRGGVASHVPEWLPHPFP